MCRRTRLECIWGNETIQSVHVASIDDREIYGEKREVKKRRNLPSSELPFRQDDEAKSGADR